MKRIILSITLLFLIFQHGITQSFTTTVTGAKITDDLIYPLQATGSLQFTVLVKNNETLPNGNTYSVSIDKPGMLPRDSWIAIDYSSQSIAPQETKSYLLTLTIPAGQTDNNYLLSINLIATRSGVNHSVLGKTMTIIVDNSQPDNSQINLDYSTSNTIRVTFDGYDSRSSFYTSANTASGYNGIKNFTLTLKNQAGTTVANTTIDATAVPRAYLFPTLVPFTTYNASVTAIDLADNSRTSDPITVITKPGAPTNFVASSTSYCRITLSWDAMPGATSYRIWIDQNTVYSTTSTTYTFSGLTVATSYNFNVRSVGPDGSGDVISNNFSTASVQAPVFSSSLTMCTYSQTIVVNPVGDATSYDWTVTNPLTINGTYSATTTGNSVGLNASVLSGTSTITVKANTLCGISSNIATGLVKVGIPVKPGTIGFRRAGGTCYYQAFISPVSGADSYDWSVDNVNWDLDYGTSYGLFDPYSTVTVYVRARNGCGVSPTKSKTQTMGNTPPDCMWRPVQIIADSTESVSTVSDNIIIYPNPAESEVTVCVSGVSSISSSSEDEVYIKSATFIDSYGQTRKILHYGTGLKSVTINISDLPNGFYYISLNNNAAGKSYKLLIQK